MSQLPEELFNGFPASYRSYTPFPSTSPPHSQAAFYPPSAHSAWFLPPTPLQSVPRDPTPTPAPFTPSPKAQKARSQGTRAQWTWEDRRLLGELLLADKTNSTAQGGHKKSAWLSIAEALNKQRTIGGPKTIRACQSARDYTCTDIWEPLATLARQSGFGWDPSRQVVDAPDDVWDDYIKASGKGKIYRGRTKTATPLKLGSLVGLYEGSRNPKFEADRITQSRVGQRLTFQAHPESRKWRNFHWDAFETWDAYLGDNKAHGRNVVRPGRQFEGLRVADIENGSDDEILDDDEVRPLELYKFASESSVSQAEAIPETQRSPSRASTRSTQSATAAANPASSSKRKASGPDSMLAIAEQMSQFNHAVRESMRKGKKTLANDRLAEAIDHIEDLAWLDDADKVQVINQLGEQPRKVEILLKLAGGRLERGLLEAWLDR